PRGGAALLRRCRLPARLPGGGHVAPAESSGVRGRPPDESVGESGAGGLRESGRGRDPHGVAPARLRRRRLPRGRPRGPRGDRAQRRGCLRSFASGRRDSVTHAPPFPARPLLLVARQELLLAVRSRWTQIFAAVFGILCLTVASSGYVLSGGHGVQDFARTAASLVQLVLLLVPLTALLIGVLSFAPDRGAAELLFSQPVSRGTILLGKLLGLLEA